MLILVNVLYLENRDWKLKITWRRKFASWKRKKWELNFKNLDIMPILFLYSFDCISLNADSFRRKNEEGDIRVTSLPFSLQSSHHELTWRRIFQSQINCRCLGKDQPTWFEHRTEFKDYCRYKSIRKWMSRCTRKYWWWLRFGHWGIFAINFRCLCHLHMCVCVLWCVYTYHAVFYLHFAFLHVKNILTIISIGNV